MFERKYDPIKPGDKFGKLTVVRKQDKPGVKRGNMYWLCVCECGNEKLIDEYQLRYGASLRCKEEYNEEKKTRIKHGGSHMKLYETWRNMKRRCSQTGKDSKNYYERGIHVCHEWEKSFASFRDWAFENGYEEGLTIDRIDNDGDYTPDNCRWVTHSVQNRNKRSNVYLEMDGARMAQADWAKVVGVRPETIKERTERGLDIREVLSPVWGKRGRKGGEKNGKETQERQ